MAIYLDYNATTPIDSIVVNSIVTALKEEWGNPSSSHVFGNAARLSINSARKKLAHMINALDQDIIFTSGGTESNNMVICSAAETYKKWKTFGKTDITSLKPHIITSNVEHDAIVLPLKHLINKNDIEVSFVPVDSNGCIVIEDVISSIQPNTCLITILFANNETGVIMPIASIGKTIRKINEDREHKGLCKILYHTDAAQAIGKLPVDVEDTMVDYLTIVGHKFYGPRIGCLYARSPGMKTPVYPMLFGGGQERGYRPGTENTPMISGLGKAADLVISNLNKYMDHFSDIKLYLENRLKEEFGNHVIFNFKGKGVDVLPNTCSIAFTEEGLTGHQVLAHCKKVLASVGAACHSENQCSGVLIASGITKEQAEKSIRLSVGRETTLEEIDLAVADLKQAVELLRKKI